MKAPMWLRIREVSYLVLHRRNEDTCTKLSRNFQSSLSAVGCLDSQGGEDAQIEPHSPNTQGTYVAATP